MSKSKRPNPNSSASKNPKDSDSQIETNDKALKEQEKSLGTKVDENSHTEARLDLEKVSQIPRINFSHIGDMIAQVINLEKGILYSLKRFIVNPEDATDEYLYRDRSKLVHPIRFLIFTSAIFAFLMFRFGIGDAAFEEGLNLNISTDEAESQEEVEALDISERLIHQEFSSEPILSGGLALNPESFHGTPKEAVDKEQMKHDLAMKIMDAFKDNFQILYVFSVVFISFFTWLFYRKKKGYNYAENVVIISFITGIQNSLHILIFPLVKIAPIVFTIATVVIALFGFYAMFRVFSSRRFLGFLKLMVCYGLAQFCYMIMLVILMGIFMAQTLGVV